MIVSLEKNYVHMFIAFSVFEQLQTKTKQKFPNTFYCLNCIPVYSMQFWVAQSAPGDSNVLDPCHGHTAHKKTKKIEQI